MSTINTTVLLKHEDSQISVSAATSEILVGKDAVFLNIDLTTANYQVAPSEITSQRAVCVRLVSGDDVVLGIDGSAYPFRITGTGGHLFRFNTEDSTEVTTVTAEADTAGSLGGDYFELYDRAGLVRVWLDVAGGSAAPAAGGGRLIEVDIASGATAGEVAAAIQIALDADAEFTATVLGAVITVTDNHTGTRAAATVGTTGWAVAPVETVAGATFATKINMKSKGTSQVMIGVVPI